MLLLVQSRQNEAPAGDSQSERYHRYAQRVAEQQIASLAKRAGSPGLYLDLPLGVHPDGERTDAAPSQ